MDTDRKPSFAKWFFLTWLASPVLFALAAMAVFGAINSFTSTPIPQGQAATAVMIGVLVGVVVGPFLGVTAWLIRRGVGGWVDAFTGRSAAPTDGTVPSAPVPAPEGVGEAPVTIDPWQGTNPYGCCTFHTDDEGYPTHGGPGCKHPEAQGRR